MPAGVRFCDIHHQQHQHDHHQYYHKYQLKLLGWQARAMSRTCAKNLASQVMMAIVVDGPVPVFCRLSPYALLTPRLHYFHHKLKHHHHQQHLDCGTALSMQLLDILRLSEPTGELQTCLGFLFGPSEKFELFTLVGEQSCRCSCQKYCLLRSPPNLVTHSARSLNALEPWRFCQI